MSAIEMKKSILRWICLLTLLMTHGRVPADNLLIEAETCKEHGFTGVVPFPGQAGGDALLLLDEREDPKGEGYEAAFPFEIKECSPHHLWAAVTLPYRWRYTVWRRPPLALSASPFYWRLDEGPWTPFTLETPQDYPPLAADAPSSIPFTLCIREAFNRSTIGRCYGPDERLGWVKLDSRILTPGRHRLVFRVSERRAGCDRSIRSFPREHASPFTRYYRGDEADPLIRGRAKRAEPIYLFGIDRILITSDNLRPRGLFDVKDLARQTPPIPPIPIVRAAPPGPPLTLSCSLGLPWDNAVLKRLGFSLFQMDSDHLGVGVDWKGEWDWRDVDQGLKFLRDLRSDWMYFPHYHWPPEWYRARHDFTPCTGLRTGARLACFSAWGPGLISWMDFGYGALVDRFKHRDDGPAAVFLGVHGEFGETLFPMIPDWGRERYGKAGATTKDFWCGADADRVAFRHFALERHGNLANLNARWGVTWTCEEKIDFPPAAYDPSAEILASPASRRRWLDFIEWYQGGMTDLAAGTCRVGRKHFPNELLFLGLGGGDEDLRLGQDSTALVKAARRFGVHVRSTHGAHLPFAQNCASMMNRIATACRFYGVPFWLESPSARPFEREVSRFMENLSGGCYGFWTWASRPLNTADLYLEYANFLTREEPLTDVAVFFPTTHHRLHPDRPYPRRIRELGPLLRDVMNYDIVDEELIRDGALGRYRTLLWLEGEYVEEQALRTITDWTRAGGVLVKCGGIGPQTIDGNQEAAREWMGFQAGYTLTLVGRHKVEPAHPFFPDCTHDGKAIETDARAEGLDVTRIQPLAMLGKSPAAWAVRIGKGWSVVWASEADSATLQRGFLELARQAVYHPSRLDPAIQDAPEVDAAWDGVYTTVFKNGEAIAHNPSDKTISTRIAGQAVTLPPWSMRSVALDRRPAAVAVTTTSPTQPLARAPFRLIFSNDTTNIYSCTSPYHQKGEPFRPEMLQATVDETVGHGVDAHLLQPAHCWVPWWPSRVYPLEEHHRWWRAFYGVEPKLDFHDYLLAGGDIVRVFVDRCLQRGQAPFISFRLNDGHHLENVNKPRNLHWPHGICRFYAEHPEYRIGNDPGEWDQRVQNWAIDEVRQYKLSLIEELCRNYPLQGLELDFLRHSSFFRPGETTSAQRRAIMCEFVAQVRRLLEETARPGQRRWLCVRIPCHLTSHDRLGIDVRELAAVGVDMFNLASYYFTEQQTDLGRIRAMVPDRAVYLELTHIASHHYLPKGDYDTFRFRRVTDEQFYTTAHLAYARGANGLSLFNFVYFREHGSKGRGPFNEPPFHVLDHLKDPDWLARQPQHYFMGKIWDTRPASQHSLPWTAATGEQRLFELDMAPPTGGWRKGGRLRIQSEQTLGESVWQAFMNGQPLEETGDASEPYPNPYPPLLGTPETLRAWHIPPDLPRDGINTIELRKTSGARSVTIVFLDAAIQ